MNTPAVTMVAAWMRAETGVGPSIASGSQVCSRNCADLPIAPMNSSRQAIVSASQSTPMKWIVLPARPGAAANIWSKVTEPVSTKIRKMPSAKPKSPTRLTTKALIAAALADGFRTRSRSADRTRGRRPPSRRTSAPDCRPSPASAWRR